MRIIKEEINRIREIMSLSPLNEEVEIVIDSEVESILQGKNVLKRGHRG